MRAISVVTGLVALVLFAAGSADAKRQLEIKLDKDGVDLAERTITFKLNRAAEMAELKVLSAEGEVLEEKVEVYDGAPAGTELSISWPKLINPPENFAIELKVHDVDEFWVGMSICRFHGAVPHEEVVFESGKWEVRPSEAPKLKDVLPKIVEMLERSKACAKNDRALYVAGYTDSVGSKADNLELSRKRARAIAEFFLKNGLKKHKIPVYVRGFGEDVQAVETDDNVPEGKNRRADYIISNFPPQIPGPGAWVKIK